jgi:hypothetical protein
MPKHDNSSDSRDSARALGRRLVQNLVAQPSRLLTAKPIRYLGRRVVQAMAEGAVANFILGKRSVPGRFVVVRLAATDDEREGWEQEFGESRAAITAEVNREAEARNYRLRSALDLELLVLTERDLGADALAAAAAAGGLESMELATRLRERGEVILARRTRTVQLESDPPGAAVYLDGRQVDRVTPCSLGDLEVGEHLLRLALPGHLLHETRLAIQEGGPRRQRYHARLEPEPPMAVLEVETYPERARVRIGAEERLSPTAFRLPAGQHRVDAWLDGYQPGSLAVDLTADEGESPRQVALRLDYAGADREEPVGRLIVYRPDPGAAAPASPSNPVADFFRDAPESQPPPTEAPVVGERPLYRGVLLIGRDDPGETVRPDVRLRDPGNTVSRGCHAWLHVYSDPGTGADYNTFVIHNASAKGIRVDGKLVTGSTALGDDVVVEVGIFRMRILKESGEPWVEL